MKFVIWTPGFDINNGGVIALHLLCHRLALAGHDARLWPWQRPEPRPKTVRRFLSSVRRYSLRGDRDFDTGPFPNVLAGYRDLKDAVVVYPEIATGNPLGSRRVVRWLLHRPGFHTGEVEYGKDDLFFYFMKQFDDPSLNSEPNNELLVTWTNPVYRDAQRAEREGSCFLVRKGVGRPFVHDEASIPIDGLSHEETNCVFNRTERLYCYDPYTRYAMYAAVAGCLPIVVPEPGVSKEQWMPSSRDRYGIAYGDGDVDWAIATRPDLLRRLREDEDVEGRLLQRFIAKCHERFGADLPKQPAS